MFLRWFCGACAGKDIVRRKDGSERKRERKGERGQGGRVGGREGGEGRIEQGGGIGGGEKQQNLRRTNRRTEGEHVENMRRTSSPSEPENGATPPTAPHLAGQSKPSAQPSPTQPTKSLSAKAIHSQTSNCGSNLFSARHKSNCGSNLFPIR